MIISDFDLDDIQVSTTSKDRKMREIIKMTALNCDWYPAKMDNFHSGDEMGFDHGDIKVRADVTFDLKSITVNLTSPFRYKDERLLFRMYKWMPLNLHDKTGLVEKGIAPKEWIERIKDSIIDLYSDWVILQPRKEEIRRKVASFPEYCASFAIKEQERIAPLKERLMEYCKQSGELKRRFKRGEMTQKEYVTLRQPIHKEIVNLMEKTSPRDPFKTLFQEEIRQCLHVKDIRSLVESI